MASRKKYQIEYLATTSLHPNPRNARKHSDKQIAQLAASIDTFDNLEPIITDTDRNIVAGHGRWHAAKKLKFPEVPVIRVEFRNEDQKAAFALASNRLGDLSSWDEDLLQEELEALFDSDCGIDITGFSTADLDFAIAPEKPAPVEERVELPGSGIMPVSRSGDIWIAGPHRAGCGDAADTCFVEVVLDGRLAVLVFGDLPYNVPTAGHIQSGKGKHNHRDLAGAFGQLSSAEFTAFMRAIFRNCTRFSTAGSIHYQCMDWRHAREILDAADGVYTEFKQLLVWDKGSGGLGSFYRSQHELIFVFKSGRGKHINNFGLGEKGRYRTNVLAYPGCATFGKGRSEELAAHATVKNSAMVADLLLDCSNRGDLVFDPTLGTGTTLLSAHRTGRQCAGIEIDPIYVDTALRRLTAISGIIPVLEGDGRTFDEVAAARKTERED